MKYSKIKTGCIDGFKVENILVEIDVNSRSTQQTFKIVGMPSTSVLESEKRVTSAIRNTGFTIPNGSIVANLSPTSMRKDGSHFDLPIAVSLLEASGQIKELSDDYYIFGELGLNGEVRPVSGISLFCSDRQDKTKNSTLLFPLPIQICFSFLPKYFYNQDCRPSSRILPGRFYGRKILHFPVRCFPPIVYISIGLYE